MSEHVFVTPKTAEREEARRLRAAGMSVRRIANRLDVALSSVSVWVRDIPVERLPAPNTKRAPEPDGEPLVEGEKMCGKCRQTLPLASFNRDGDGRQHWCRDCFRTYFAARDGHRAHVRRNTDARRVAARRHVLAYLRGHPCTDCGESDTAVLEFDHVRGTKTKAISQLVVEAAGMPRLDRELDKCEVVCVSCHRRRTARRAGWYSVTHEPRPWWTRGQRRNAEYLAGVLAGSACVDCGESDAVVLDFDHRGDKVSEVSKLAVHCGLATLQAEIAKCDVRCANCHRRKTLRAAGAWRIADDVAMPPEGLEPSSRTLKRRAR